MRGVCKKCGVEHLTPLGYPACKAHRSKTGAACRANPVRGATVCSKHNGMNAAVRRKAAERVAMEKVEQTLGDLMAEHTRAEEHPIEALADMVVRLATVTRWVEARLSALGAATPDEETQAAIGLYTAQVRSFANVAKVLLDARLEERLMRLYEWQTDRMFSAVLQGMRAVNLSFEQQDELRAAIAAELLGDETPEQQERRAHAYWQRQQQAYRALGT